MKKTTLLDFEINRTKKTNRWLGLLSVCMMFLVGQLSFAQVQVGYDTTASYNAPFSNLWGYSYTQSIYTSAELSANAGTITAINYYYAGTTTLNTLNNFTLYIGHTTQSNFSSTTNWVPFADLTEVFSGGITATGAGWVTITLDTPFVYDGTSNLVIAFDENQASYTSSQTFRYSATGNAKTIQYRNDSTNPDPATPPTASVLHNFVANTQFVGLTSNLTAPTCLDAAPAFAETSAGCGNLGGTLSWTAPATGFVSGYKVYIGTSSGNYDLVNGTVVTGLSYTMANSAINTTYYYSIVPTNPAGDAMACDEYSFTTASNICYCTPTTTGTYYLTNVTTTGGSTNISHTATAKAPGGYADLTATQIVTAWEGQEIGVSLSANTSTHYFFGWIDANGDGTFDNDTEKIIDTSTGYLLTWNGTLTIPNLPLGDYRIRVGSSWSGVIQPCGSANGEYKDFTLTVTAPPPCMAPTALTATNITPTVADLGWTGAGTAYDIEIVEAGTTPTGTPTYTGATSPFTTTTALNPSTSYEFYVRQNCGGTESTWTGPFSFTTECLPPSITGTTPGSVCGQGEIELSATADAGASIGWYAAQTGGAKLAEGATFTTPLISETTSYWVAAATPGNSENVGPVNPSSIGTEGGYSTSLAYVTFFTVTNATTVETVDIFPNSPLGTAGSIIIRDVTNGNTIVGTYPYTVTSTGSTIVAQTVAINQSLPAGNYSMGMETTVVSLYRNTAGATFPYVGADISLTGQGFTGFPEYFYYFYNWSVSSSCSSARTEVIATVTVAPALVLSETVDVICEGATSDAVTITTGAADYDTYVWNPATGVSGDATNGWTFNPTATTTYTLTASNSTTECATSVDFVVTVNAAPTVNGITASAVEICEGTSVDIAVNIPAPATYCSVTFEYLEPISLVQFAGINNATSAATAGAVAYEDFTSIVGNVTAGATAVPITLNGNTDGGFTNNFYVYIDWNQNGVFTDPGETYSIGSITNNNGTGPALTGSIDVPATALNGNTRMRVLKKYSASTDPGSCNTTGFGQAEDYTVNVTGGVDLDTYSWSDGTSVVGTASTLTVNPTATTTYTVIVTGSNGCTSTESVTITVNPAPAAPTNLACYETATFNIATCQWDITGEQPEQPALACYETATFDEVSCAWVVTGTQPAQPTTELACYESYVFNDATCAWEVTGTQPVEPTDLACYETATFDEVSCAWVVTGTAPATPTADSPQPMSVGQTVSEIVVTDVTGTLNWYSDEDLTSVVDESTELTEGTHTFWVTQTIDGCESDAIQIVVEVTLSTNVFDNASFRTYPNPVKDFFNVSYSKEITNISVVNMLGQTVLEKAVNATDTQIDMTSLPTGSYFVKVTVEGNSKTVKVIKQ